MKIYRKALLTILTICLLSLPGLAKSKHYSESTYKNDTLTRNELFRILRSSSNYSKVIFEDCVFKSEISDRDNSITKSDSITICSSVFFNRCKFYDHPVIRNKSFVSTIEFNECEVIGSLYFFNSDFNELTIKHSKIFVFSLQNCNVNKKFTFFGNNIITELFITNTIFKSYKLSQPISNQSLNGPTQTYNELIQVRMNSGEDGSGMIFKKCSFKGLSSKYDVVNIESSRISRFTFANNNISAFCYLGANIVSETYELYRNKFSYGLDLTNTMFPGTNVVLDYKDISEILRINASDGGFHIKKYQSNHINNFINTGYNKTITQNDYVRINSLLAQLINSYKTKGEFEDYGLALSDFRDIQRNYLYDSKPYWLLLTMFKYSCSYGAKPEKALYLFLAMCIIFSIINYMLLSTRDTYKNYKVLNNINDTKCLHESVKLSISNAFTFGLGIEGRLSDYNGIFWFAIIEGTLGWLLITLFVTSLFNLML